MLLENPPLSISNLPFLYVEISIAQYNIVLYHDF